MKKIFTLSVYFLFFITYSFAQNWTKQWDKRFGTTGNDELYAFQQTADGGFLLGGYTASGVSGDKSDFAWGGEDFWIVKLDASGSKQWDERYGGTDHDQLFSFQQTSEGGYILGGYSYSGIGGDKSEFSWGSADYWVVKIDSLGNKQWDKRFGGTLNDYLYSVKQTSDGGYILGGWTMSSSNGDKSQTVWGSSDYWVVKIDSQGIKQWDKRYGGTGTDELFAMQQTLDGGYIFGGCSRSGATGDKTQAAYAGSNDYWIIKVNSEGKKQWDKRYGGTGNDELYALELTPDGGYILGGWSTSGIGSDKSVPNAGAEDAWIIKVDSAGKKLWDHVYGGTSTEDVWDGNIFPTTDGGFLIGCTSYSSLSGNKTENDLGLEQSWVVKINALGIKQWDKTILTPGHDEASFVVQTKDGCYAVANYTDAGIGGYKSELNWDSTEATRDFWIVKFCADSIQSVPPDANFAASNTSLCVGECISFANLSHDALSYQWIFPGGFPSSSADSDPANVCYYASGSYDVILIAYSSSGSDTLTFSKYINVHEIPPTPVINLSNDTLYCSFNQEYKSFQWYADKVLIPSATASYLVISENGNYNIQVTNDFGCSIAVGINVVITDVSKFMNDDSQAGCWIYPNPVKNEFSIYGMNSNFKNKITLEIYNLPGENVLRKETKLVNGKSETVIDISFLPSGMYFLLVKDENKSWLQRIIKE